MSYFWEQFFFYFHKDSLVFPGERKVSKASIFSRPLHHWERIKIFLNVYKIPDILYIESLTYIVQSNLYRIAHKIKCEKGKKSH